MNSYKKLSDTGEVSSWDWEKLAADLPNIFKTGRNKTNGQKTISIRKAPGLNGRGSSNKQVQALEKIERLITKQAALEASGELPQIWICTNAGWIVLNEDAREFVNVNAQLGGLVFNGWTVEVK